MHRTAATARCLAVALAASAWAAATDVSARAADPTITATDARGDVRVFRTHGQPIPTAQKRSIDLREVAFTPRTDATVRIAVTIKKVLRTTAVDQMIFIRFVPVATSTGEWVSADIGWSPQKPRKWAYASLDRGDYDYLNCTAQRLHTDRIENTLSVDIPNRCIPTGPTRVVVSALTGKFRTDAPVHSKDALKVPGTATVR